MLNFLIKKSTENRTKEQPLINILTRTSGRPVGFSKCYHSIANQSYKKVRHIVSYDDPQDLEYLKDYQVEKIAVKREKTAPISMTPPEENSEFKPYNLYCNELLSVVEEGWIMFLDDDDMLSRENVLEEITNYILKNNTDTLFFWKTRFPNGFLLPSNSNFRNKKVILQQIDTACFLFHSKYKSVSHWDCWWAADYRFIKELSDTIPDQKWIPKTFTQKNNFGDQGKRNDIIK